jgi:hypothetical protein
MIVGTRRRGVRSAFGVSLVDHVGELAQVGVKSGKQALQSAPPYVAPAALDTGKVWRGEFGAGRQLVLCEPSAGSQDAYRVADFGLSGTYHIVKVALRLLAQNIVGARAGRTAGRRGTGSANSRRSEHPTEAGTVFFSPRAVLSGPPHHDWRTDMTTITIPARIVRYLREALHSQLGVAAEDIGQVSHEGGSARPVLYAEPIERFDRTRALLDLIGWKQESDESPAIVNLAGHRQALLTALQAQVETERNMVSDDPTLKGAEKQIVCARRRVADLEQFLALAGLSLGDSA